MAAHILLVEDNRDHLELMSYLLRAFGHKPMSVGSGEAGMGVALHKRPDLVICDLMLGRASGFELAQFFKSHAMLKDVPLVAVSALWAESAGPKALAAGFDGFIQKPISPERFVLEVQRFVKISLIENLEQTVVAANTQEPVKRSAPPRRGVILVVDDRQANLDLAGCLLEQFGFTVITADGVREGLASARLNLPSLIMTDVHMGDGSGFDLLKTVRGDPNLQHIPCLVTSATYLDADPRAMEFGLDDRNFILRPVDPQVLLSKIDGCLARWGTEVHSQQS